MPLTLTEEAEIFGRYIEKQVWVNLEDDANFEVFRSSIYRDKSINWGVMSAISCSKRKLVYLLWRYLGGALRGAEVSKHLANLIAQAPNDPWNANLSWARTKEVINRVKADNGYPPMADDQPVKAQQQDTDEFFNNLGKPYEGRISVERGADGNIAAFKLDPATAKERPVTASEALGAPYGTATGRMSSSQLAFQELSRIDYEGLMDREWASAGGSAADDP